MTPIICYLRLWMIDKYQGQNWQIVSFKLPMTNKRYIIKKKIELTHFPFFPSHLWKFKELQLMSGCFKKKNTICNIYNFLINSIISFYILNYPALYTIESMSPVICKIIWSADMTPVQFMNALYAAVTLLSRLRSKCSWKLGCWCVKYNPAQICL